MNKHKCMIWPTLIDLNPDELHYYPFFISANSCDGSCNTDKDPFGRLCVPNKIEVVNPRVFNIIKRINEWGTLSYEVRCEFDGCKCNSI